MKLFESKPDDVARVEPEMPSAGPARYSQPLPESRRADSGQVVFAGFTRDGEAGFIVRERGRKANRVEATRQNAANEKPRGFFSSLARLWSGGKTK